MQPLAQGVFCNAEEGSKYTDHMKRTEDEEEVHVLEPAQKLHLGGAHCFYHIW